MNCLECGTTWIGDIDYWMQEDKSSNKTLNFEPQREYKMDRYCRKLMLEIGNVGN